MPDRSGVSLIELMVALALLGVGLLALSAGVAALARHAAAAAGDARGAAVAAELLERAAVARCTAAGSGETTLGPARVRWSVVAEPGARTLRVAAGRTADGAAPERRYDARLACPGE